MKKTSVAACALVFALVLGQTLPQSRREGTNSGFRRLFNGRNLDGWDGDPRLWKVVHGGVVGSTIGVPLERNSFLISKKRYANFVLRARVRLRNHNSGIQFRSEALPGWVVRGLQADMAEGNWWGCLYDEKGTRGVIVNGWKDKAEKVVRPGAWNDYEIFCRGDVIKLKVNGLLTAELRDSTSKSGVIALQLHSGPPMKVEFRDMRIKTLP